MSKHLCVSALLLSAMIACGKKQAPISYEAVPVELRNIVVSASASGAIEPPLTVDVKSKASGDGRRRERG